MQRTIQRVSKWYKAVQTKGGEKKKIPFDPVIPRGPAGPSLPSLPSRPEILKIFSVISNVTGEHI